MSARPAIALLALLVAPLSCALATGLDDFAIARRCSGAQDCPGEDTDCSIRRCIEGACLVDALPQGTPCAGGVCDGDGACRGSNGATCLDASACASGFCADGVCCDTSCDSDCVDCFSLPGTCSSVAAGNVDGACQSPSVCDGGGVCTAGEVLWASSLTSPGGDSGAWGLTLTEDGVIISGWLQAAATFGGEPKPFGGPTYDPFTAKYDHDGNPVWIDLITDPQEALGDTVVAVPDGPIVQAGRYLNSITLNGAVVAGNAAYAIYIAGLDPDTGAHLWGRGFPEPNGLANAQALDLAASGTDVILGGRIATPTDFGNGMVVGTAGSANALLMAFDGITGTTRWVRAFDGPGNEQIRGVAVDGDGRLLVVGESTGELDLGGGALSSPNDGFHNPFVAKLRADGSHLWSTTFVAAGNNAWIRGVTADSEGHVYVTGWYLAPLQVGATLLPLVASPAEGFVAKLDGESGDVRWVVSLGGSYSYAHDAVIDEAGHLLVVGSATGMPDFGSDSPLAMLGQQDTFVLALTGEGELLWARTLGAPGGFHEGIEIDAGFGRIAVGGRFHTALTAVGTVLATDGTLDPFAAMLTP